MAALQGPRPGQGWSETRPTRGPRRALERTHAEDSAPEAAESSDSDVEVVGDPVVEERERRLRRAAVGDRIPRGTTDVEGAELPRGHAEAVCRATEETQKRFRDREPSDEEQQRTTEEEARWQVRLRQDHEAAAARWHARLQEAEEEERRLWEEPWLPEVPPTPRYEGEGFANGVRDTDGGAPLATPPWRPARPPTPRYAEPERPDAQPQSEQPTAQPQPQLHEEATNQAQTEEQTVVRTEVPGAHVSHSTRAFVAEGVRCRQQTVVWTWLEGLATAPTREEPRIREKGVPKVSPRDPPDPQRPPLQRQTSTTGPTRQRPQFTRQISAPEEGGWREIARS
ncbi:uncharacterized protein [Drosophila suzukii]|uniref:Uncharacterized protein n=1 Tax=Drosophila suzukii TaxID=28584 RepID=A0ABM4TYV0_DROSZ